MVGSRYKGKVISKPINLPVFLVYLISLFHPCLFSHKNNAYFQEVSAFNHTLNLTLQLGTKGRSRNVFSYRWKISSLKCNKGWDRPG